MIVQDKQKEPRYFGAIQFNEKQAKKSLAMYPGITKANPYDLYKTYNQENGEYWTSIISENLPMNKDIFLIGSIMINDGDWLVTDMDGKTHVYNDTQFKEQFVGKDGDNL